MFRRNLIRYALPLVIICVTGCDIDFLGYPPPTITVTPTPQQIQYCRDVMYINTDVEIVPLGFYFEPSLDDLIRFKFVANTNDPTKLFDSTQVPASKFSTDFGVDALRPEAKESWWDVGSQKLTGGSFSVPPPKAQGSRGLNIGYKSNDDGTLTVYVLWHET
jgi:hypothetical protein